MDGSKGHLLPAAIRCAVGPPGPERRRQPPPPYPQRSPKQDSTLPPRVPGGPGPRGEGAALQPARDARRGPGDGPELPRLRSYWARINLRPNRNKDKS
jgi:hypothetical protein